MAPVFVLPDIVNILAAFPPQNATVPSTLFRSHSGNRLVHFEAAEERFEDLLSSSQNRLSLHELPKLLDIDVADSFADRPNVWYWKPEQEIIPRSEADRLTAELSKAVESVFVAIRPWAAQRKVSRHDLIDVHVKRGSWIVLEDSSQNTTLLTSVQHYEQLKTLIVAHIDEARAAAKETNFSTSLGLEEEQTSDQFSIPSNILYDMTKTILNDLNVSEGTLVGSLTKDDSGIRFAPYEWQESQRMQEHAEQEARVNRALHQLDAQGYIILSKDQHNIDKDAIASKVPSGTTCVETPKGMALITTSTYGRLSDQFEKLATQYVQTKGVKVLERPSKAALDPELLDWIIHRCDAEESLVRMCVDGKDCAARVHAALVGQMEHLEEDDRTRFSVTFMEALTAPVCLYAGGVAFVQDDQLKQRLDDAAGELVCKDILKRTIEEWRKNHMLWHKERRKQVDKLYESIDKTSTTTSLQVSIAKAARKLGIEEPPSTIIQERRTEILQQNLQGMKKMQRGSDVLQNTIWILLSQVVAKHHGVHALFVSSGKDTSRMIKLYRSNGDSSVATFLEQWRDALKVGADSEAMRDDMISAAADGLRSHDGSDGETAPAAAS